MWVGLDDVEWDAPDGSTVISAVVRYTNKTKDELTKIQIETKGKIVARHTDPDAHFQMGAVEMFAGEFWKNVRVCCEGVAPCPKRMTWEEIKEKYPDQWVGLTAVEYEPDNDSTIKSAVVKCADKTANELTLMQIRTKGKNKGNVYCR